MADDPKSDQESIDQYLRVVYSKERAPQSDYPEKLAAFLRERVCRGSGALLDIGSGSGDMARAFASQGYEVATTDVSSEAGERCADLEFHQANIEKESLPFRDGQFSFVFSKSVVEHLRSPEKFFAEAWRVLEPGGKLVVMTPSWMHQSWGPFYVDSTHVTPFTMRSLRDMFLMHEFKVPEVKHFYQLPILWNYPFLIVFARIVAALPIRYRPFFDASWSDSVNKVIRFSNEVMLLGVGEKSRSR